MNENSQPDDPAIDVVKLTKRYGAFAALNELTLTVPRSAVFGLLGPNGAGKTTLIRSLLGYIRPTSGNAKVLGFDVVQQSLAVRSHCAYLPAEAKMFRAMRGRSVMRFFAEIHPFGNFDRIAIIADRLQLEVSRHVAFMSTGMRQKLAIACVMGLETPLVVLDEPTSSLDPNARQTVLQLVREARQRGSTVVLSSHVMEEIEDVCDAAVIITGGSTQRTVDIQQLKRTAMLTLDRPLEPGLRREGISVGTSTTIVVDGDTMKLDDCIKELHAAGHQIVRIESTGLKAVYESCSHSC